jgi:hypothetical protein
VKHVVRFMQGRRVDTSEASGERVRIRNKSFEN